MRMNRTRISWVMLFALVVFIGTAVGVARVSLAPHYAAAAETSQSDSDQAIDQNAAAMLSQGRQTFRYDSFGDEAFWTDALKLNLAIEGQALGGAGGGVSPKTALAVGLKVDMDKLPPSLVEAIKAGKVDLDSPATTLALLQLNAVVGVKAHVVGQGADTRLRSV